MSLRERLISFLADKKISQAKFEKQVGLSNGFVNNIGEGISTQSLIKILEAYPDLNATWLLTGSGEMLLTEHFVLNEGARGYEKKSGTLRAPDIDLLTLVKKQIKDLQTSLQTLDENLILPVDPGTTDPRAEGVSPVREGKKEMPE